MDLLKSKSIFLDLRPIHLIRNGLDIYWTYFLIVQNEFWVGFWPGPGPGSLESIWIQVEQSWPESVWAVVEPSRSWPKSSLASLGKNQVESTRVLVEFSGLVPRVSIGPRKKSNEVNPGPSQVKLAQTHVETSRPRLMSIWVDLRPCWS